MYVDSQQTRATTHIMSRYLTTINDLMYVIMKQKQLVLEKVQDFSMVITRPYHCSTEMSGTLVRVQLSFKLGYLYRTMFRKA